MPYAEVYPPHGIAKNLELFSKILRGAHANTEQIRRLDKNPSGGMSGAEVYMHVAKESQRAENGEAETDISWEVEVAKGHFLMSSVK